MPIFSYQALTKTGGETKGVCEADSLKTARQLLRSKQLTILHIKATYPKQAKNTLQSWWQQLSKRIPVLALSLITRQFATLLGAGVSLEETLSSVAEQNEKQEIKNIVLGIRSKILEGYSFARALEEYPQVFSHLYCASVSAGEKTGHLEKVLERLADFVERRHQIRQQIMQAAIYPSIVTLIAIGIVSFLLSFVVPKMVDTFLQSGQTLPAPTRILLSISNILQNWGLYILIFLITIVILFRHALQRPTVRYKWHSFLLRLPLIGRTIKLINTAHFSHTFAMLNQAGVEVLEAMRVSAETVNNVLIRNSLTSATRQVREGITIYRALQKTGYFPPLSVQLITSGENSGQLSEMLERAALTQENGVQTRINLLLTLFEPMVILLMGSVVLFIVLAILLPIFDLNQLVGG